MSRLKIVLPLFFLWIASLDGNAQVKLFGGANYCSVRNDVLKDEQPLFLGHAGIGVRVYPFKYKKVSLEGNYLISGKGYKQYADRWYELKFTYTSFQLLANYEATKFLLIQAGIDLAGLIDSNVEKGTETYNTFDGGFVLGASFFENKPIGFYTSLVYGLSPMLDYYSIDSMGNFTGEIHDLKNICLMMGVRINIYDKKISF